MVEISMCKGFACNKKNICYRHRAIPKERQPWITPALVGDECKFFFPMMYGDKTRPASIRDEVDQNESLETGRKSVEKNG